MTNYAIFEKHGARYSNKPVYICNNPAQVFHALACELLDKYVDRRPGTCTRKITRERCTYCDSFDVVTLYKAFPNGDKIKVVYTVPR